MRRISIYQMQKFLQSLTKSKIQRISFQTVVVSNITLKQTSKVMKIFDPSELGFIEWASFFRVINNWIRPQNLIPSLLNYDRNWLIFSQNERILLHLEISDIFLHKFNLTKENLREKIITQNCFLSENNYLMGRLLSYQ